MRATMGENVWAPAIHRAFARRSVGLSALILAVLSLTLFAVVGVGRSRPDSVLRPDTQILYVAGHMWLHGRSPYPIAEFLSQSAGIEGLTYEFMQSGFGYPPSAAPLCMLLAALSLRGAFLLMLGLNLVAIAALALYATRLATAGVGPGIAKNSLYWFVPAVVVGNPFTSHIVYQGQTTLIATAAVVAAWYFAHVEKRSVLAGVLLAVATIKPQVAFLPIAWVAIERQWKLLAALASVGVVLVLFPVIVGGGPVTLLQQWAGEISTYSAMSSNAPGFPNVFGIQSLLVASGLHSFGTSILVVPCFAWLWWRRARFAVEDLLGILLGVSCLFIYAHDYDLAALAPAYATVWKRSSRAGASEAGALAFFALFFAPQRFLRHSTSGALVHWREVTLLLALVWLVAEGFKRPPVAGRDRTNADRPNPQAETA